jgi:hypothetical protein
MNSLIILGRQPALGLAELESLYGPDKLLPIGDTAVIVDVDPCLLAFDRLGGAVKFARVLTELNTVSWDEIGNFLVKSSPEHSKNMAPGKMHLGISVYGFYQTPKQVQQLGLKLKRAIHATGRSVRVAPNHEISLSSAQVIHGHLCGPNGWELLLINAGEQTVIAQTIKVQDIEAYTRRDRNRPARDAKVGMLPPKLAQIIINLSSGLLPAEAMLSVCDIPPDQPLPKLHFNQALLLDPFCGSGVILQEAAIMGYDCLGSDVDQRMVDYAKTNIQWLRKLPKSPLLDEVSTEILLADATNYRWPRKPTLIASETDLGPPFGAFPSKTQLEAARNSCDRIVRGFLTNISKQIDSGTRICLALPAWQVSQTKLAHLPLLDSIEVIGYNRVSFRHSRDEQLIYKRPGQIVARELLVLSKI